MHEQANTDEETETMLDRTVHNRRCGVRLIRRIKHREGQLGDNILGRSSEWVDNVVQGAIPTKQQLLQLRTKWYILGLKIHRKQIQIHQPQHFQTHKPESKVSKKFGGNMDCFLCHQRYLPPLGTIFQLRWWRRNSKKPRRQISFYPTRMINLFLILLLFCYSIYEWMKK